MINDLQYGNLISFNANLKINDKSKKLSKQSRRELLHLAGLIGTAKDSINITISNKKRLYFDSFGYVKANEENNITVKNVFNNFRWEDITPNAFLQARHQQHKLSNPHMKFMDSLVIFDVLKDYLKNFKKYNARYFSANLSQKEKTKKAFKLPENIESISEKNISDLIPLYQKYQEGMNQAVPTNKLRNFIRTLLKNNNKIFMIKENGVPCGFLQFTISYSTIDTVPYTTLQSLFVHPDFRQKGFAKRLLQEIERWTDYNNFKGVSVKTHSKNPAAVGLYSSNGFQSEGSKYTIFFLPNKRILDYKKGYVYTKKNK